MSEAITFEVIADDGGFVASAQGVSILTQGDDLTELRRNVRQPPGAR